MATKPSNRSRKRKETPQALAARHKKLRNGTTGRAIVPNHNRAGIGRMAPNNAKEALQLAFEGAGGVPELIKWAKNNRGDFYTKLWARLIPRDVQLGTDGSLEDLLTKLEEARHGTVKGDYVEVEAEEVK